jgi:Fic family protein
MDVERFMNSPSGRLVQVQESDTSYWAFVPNPLPPELPLDAELVRTLSNADRGLGELAGLGRNLANPHLLIGPFIRREAVLSSRIEGTQSSVSDLYAFEAGQPPLPGFGQPPPENDVREVYNYVRALEYGLERIQRLPMSLRLIRELHERLMTGVRGESLRPGEFRRTQNYIGRKFSQIAEAEYVPPPVSEMLPALEEFERYVHTDDIFPPLVRLALIHYQFEAIHPFSDGNGRIGRLLISLLLVDWGLLPQPLLYLSAFFERWRQQYYDSLLAVSRDGDWRNWVMFFLQGVENQARDAVERSKRLHDLQRKWYTQLQSKPQTSVRLLQLIDFLFQAPLVRAPQVQEAIGVTHRTANQMISRLMGEGILHSVTGRERNRQFVAREILEILQDQG